MQKEKTIQSHSHMGAWGYDVDSQQFVNDLRGRKALKDEPDNGFAVIGLTEGDSRTLAAFTRREDAVVYLNTLPFRAGIFPCKMGIEFSDEQDERIEYNRSV